MEQMDLKELFSLRTSYTGRGLLIRSLITGSNRDSSINSRGEAVCERQTL